MLPSTATLVGDLVVVEMVSVVLLMVVRFIMMVIADLWAFPSRPPCFNSPLLIPHRLVYLKHPQIFFRDVKGTTFGN